MKTQKQTQTVDKKQKRDYTRPEIKKREQIKEVTEGMVPIVTTIRVKDSQAINQRRLPRLQDSRP